MVGIQKTMTQRAVLGVAGMLYAMHAFASISLANSNTTKQLDTITVDSAADAEYTVTLTDPFGDSVVASYDQGAAGTVENKVDGLVAAAYPLFAPFGVYVKKTSASTFTLESREPRVTFTSAASAQMTIVNTQAAVSGTDIPFGRGVVFEDTLGKTCKLPETVPAKTLDSILIGGNADGTYITTIAGEVITYTASGAASAAVIRDGILALIAANFVLRDKVRAFVKDADEYYIESLNNEDVETTVSAGTGSGQTLTSVTAGTVGDKFAGVAIFSHAQPNDTKYDLAGVKTEISGSEGYKSGASVSVLTEGPIWVETEEAVTVNDPVYVRAVATGTEKKGVFRKSEDSTDCILIPNGRWLRGNSGAGLAVLELY